MSRRRTSHSEMNEALAYPFMQSNGHPQHQQQHQPQPHLPPPSPLAAVPSKAPMAVASSAASPGAPQPTNSWPRCGCSPSSISSGWSVTSSTSPSRLPSLPRLNASSLSCLSTVSAWVGRACWV
ncbi:uncharacterized protein N7446_000181 [Penicillium canescens]|uniref:Uncharacterized protein n=1 Tax=Penicillium canescens TaxID=5083 RepID=A0AAD6I4P4_PENCN|nr:uncharacterized protein N7446_000181 [Penicillium canescens]KAJ6030755.1 hypothetical protein N7460_011021 [Penicillium canescens]KAJ6077245.1 hypothetical protein N7446_000181 [Penicillium canescens]KAJ6154015.1 hypothetical protein N7485_012384 [Penicillium canescens]